MNKIMVLSTAEEIAKGLREILEEYSNHKPQVSFETEKMSVSEGSKFIGVSYPTLCTWIKNGKVPVHGNGRTRFLLKSELIEAYKAIG